MVSNKFESLYKSLVEKKITVEDLGDMTDDELSNQLGKTVQVVQEKTNYAASIVADCDGISGYEEDVFKVFHIIPDDIYIKVVGIDNSYGEKVWKGLPYEVFPKKIEEIVYVNDLSEDQTGHKMTFAEIWFGLQMQGITRSDIGDGELEYKELGPIGKVEEKESWGGEGQGEKIGKVYYFPDHDVYMRIDGYYQSHYGTDWDNDPYEVRPKQKTVTVFE